jgi:hypothetical protein
VLIGGMKNQVSQKYVLVDLLKLSSISFRYAERWMTYLFWSPTKAINLS